MAFSRTSQVLTTITPSDASVTTAKLADGAVTNAKVDAAAAIDFSKLAALTSGNILVGNASNVPTSVALSGDATISNTGVLTIAANAVVTADIANSAVTSAKVDTTQVAVLGTAQEYTRTHNFNATTLTDGANISWDLSQNQVASVTLAGNRTLSNPTNQVDGAVYILIVKQDATGGRTLAFSSNYKFAGGSAPSLTTTASKADVLTFVSDGTNMMGVASLNFL